MKRILTAIFLFSIMRVANAQYQFVKQWDKVYGGDHADFVSSFMVTKNGGYVLGGSSDSDIGGEHSQSALGGSDYWVVKIDSQGNKEWDKRYGGSGDESIYEVREDRKGGYILGGGTRSGIEFDVTVPSRGYLDFWLVRIDSIGNKIWDSRFGGVSAEYSYTLEQTLDGGYIMGGFSQSPISGDKTEDNRDTTYRTDDYWVVKVDSSGRKEWDKRFGGKSQESLSTVHQTQDGGYILGGNSASNADGDKSENSWDTNPWTTNYWLVKLDSIGNKQWDKQYGTITDDWLSVIVCQPNGGYLLGGTASAGISGNKGLTKAGYWIVGIDSTGNKLFEWAYSVKATMDNMTTTTDGGYLLSGRADKTLNPSPDTDKTEDNLGEKQAWIIKIDSLGNKQWDKTIFTTGFDQYSFALEAPDGCYIVATSSNTGIGGYKTQPARNNSSDYFVVKFCMERVSSIDPLNPPKGDLIQVYPNPVSEEVSIALLNGEFGEATFTLTDVNGKTIYRKAEDHLAPGYTKVLDLRPLPKGVYFVTVQTAKEQWVKRVVKE